VALREGSETTAGRDGREAGAGTFRVDEGDVGSRGAGDADDDESRRYDGHRSTAEPTSGRDERSKKHEKSKNSEVRVGETQPGGSRAIRWVHPIDLCCGTGVTLRVVARVCHASCSPGDGG
jgi:hypothetical protein